MEKIPEKCLNSQRIYNYTLISILALTNLPNTLSHDLGSYTYSTPLQHFYMRNSDKRESIRSETLKLREKISLSERMEKSTKITSYVVEWIQNKKKLEEISFHAVMVYLNMNSEVVTEDFIDYLLKQGKRVIAPVVDIESGQLIPKHIQNLETDLEKHTYGMLQPKKACPIFPHDQIELIIVPGIAYDLNRYRLGYGKGFYDRFLPTCPNAITIGIAFQAQVVENIFPQPWDVPMHHIFTESGRVEED